jgi:hypothetical protein
LLLSVVALLGSSRRVEELWEGALVARSGGPSSRLGRPSYCGSGETTSVPVTAERSGRANLVRPTEPFGVSLREDVEDPVDHLRREGWRDRDGVRPLGRTASKEEVHVLRPLRRNLRTSAAVGLDAVGEEVAQLLYLRRDFKKTRRRRGSGDLVVPWVSFYWFSFVDHG